ncbi:prephenate dehydrogenase [Gordonia sp. PP30]|uniref:prephenate dehydrogenase n=1 Tax=unclassified Gordonia (in: high G+C Gram-positive bacteria) TaxID=2657482 RepID=UPI001FFFB15B|nr:prephenate dehydrogenase [Gordonia sp. PP30]UQE75299.1 prephenate dehydrogenase [Gordonia sp. PP30]
MDPDNARPVCILGLGLIGGSLLRVLADAGRAAYGYNRSAATVEQATAAGYDASADLAAVLRRAAADDAVVVLATPVPALGAMVAAVAEHAPGCLLTDVVSVKEEVARIVAAGHPGARYVGGHPMAGTAESGWAATDPTLFTGAMWMVTTHDDTDPHDWLAVAGIARAAGALVVPAANDAHDRAVAAISHNPHLTAAVTATVGAGESALALRLAAGSFRDGTRVAGTAPELQRAMLEGNATALLNTLSETIDRLIAARDALRDHGSVEVIVDDGHRARARYEQIALAPPHPIEGVVIGDEGWAHELRRQAHLARVWMD